MKGDRPAPDLLLIRRTARRITLLTAALFAACGLLLAGVAAAIVVREQGAEAQRTLIAAVADEDAVSDPPSGIVIYEADGGRVRASAPLNGEPLDPAAIAAVRAGSPPRTGEVRFDGREYQVRTARRGDSVVQAGLDLSDQENERHRLLLSLFVASAAGLGLAVAAGAYIARRAVRPLEVASERQRRFIADASHELRTPLTQVHTRAQLIQRGLRRPGPHDALAGDADRLVRSTRLLNEILEELLLAAQLRSDRVNVELVDVGAIATEAVAAEDLRAADAGVTLTLTQDAGPHLVRGSAPALRRVFNSLIDNAFGHTETGGTITVEVRRAGTELPAIVFVVRDDGTGFEDADAAVLFERFARGERGTGGGSGPRFGLGLALVQEVVTAHGGSVTAASQPGDGADFTVTLPAAPSADVAS